MPLIIELQVKLKFIKKFISECDKINQYFDTSHTNNTLLRQEFTNIKIKGNKELKDNAFHKAALAAIKIWQGFGYTHKEKNTNIALINSIISLEVENEIANISDNNSPLEPFSSTKLAISDIVDLIININDNNKKRRSNITLAQVQQPDSADLIYDFNDILNEFLEYKNENNGS
ncbi:hypothetical protein C1645_814811 [Glomus cerebriforme]|uniref:Uncharacterized protein n=1 Tax=Glomus cerebriforme TaxID=658196 RepID=A0A397TKE2_9GLOM|nr:hypothetical protein C1645_814811 [Glomus cerebriforme]